MCLCSNHVLFANKKLRCPPHPLFRNPHRIGHLKDNGIRRRCHPDPPHYSYFNFFFTTQVIAVLVEQSNPRARARGFNPLTVGEFYRYLGCLVYMGIYKYPEIRDYWKHNVIGTRLGLSRDRFKEIQAVFTFRNPDILPMQPSDPWWFRLEPLASSIRDSCQRYWIPGAKLAIDEGMIAYHGHTHHTIKPPTSQ
jgi:Transposase IS4